MRFAAEPFLCSFKKATALAVFKVFSWRKITHACARMCTAENGFGILVCSLGIDSTNIRRRVAPGLVRRTRRRYNGLAPALIRNYFHAQAREIFCCTPVAP